MKPKHSITLHALDQCEARHGYRPSNAHADVAVLDIIERRALLAWRHPHGHEEWIVRLACADVRVVYDPTTRCIITVLDDRGRGLRHDAPAPERTFYATSKPYQRKREAAHRAWRKVRKA